MTEVRDFWSRRKAAVEAEEEAVRARANEAAVEQERAALDEKTDEELLAEFNLPNPDELQPGDDISGFMQQAVPDRLRRRALRKLWRLNPLLANVDGLVDYGEDFTDGALVVENLQTAYQVGKGMLRHVEALAAAAEEKAAGKTPEDALAQEPEAVADAEPEVRAPQEADAAPTAAVETPPEYADADVDAVAPTRRRMRFAFEAGPDAMEGHG